MRLVILESPYAGDVERNIRYARAAVRDSLLRGEAPIASHLLYTQEGILRDDVPEERRMGINAGLDWGRVADATVVYHDLGLSKGMVEGIHRAQLQGRMVELRTLGKEWDAGSKDPVVLKAHRTVERLQEIVERNGGPKWREAQDMLRKELLWFAEDLASVLPKVTP